MADVDVSDTRCGECGHDGLTRKQLPAPGGPSFRIVCPECGTVYNLSDGGNAADKR